MRCIHTNQNICAVLVGGNKYIEVDFLHISARYCEFDYLFCYELANPNISNMVGGVMILRNYFSIKI